MKTISQFLQSHKSILIEKLEHYLLNPKSHDEVQEYVWNIIDKGQNFSELEPYEKGENIFWATVWALQHLADDDHIKLDSTQTQLKTLLALLKNGGSLPDGWTGNRP